MDDAKARAWQPGEREGLGWRAEHGRMVIALTAVHEPRRILDLGCGVGDFDARVLDAMPAASITCLDGSPVMVERTREALAAYGERASVVQSPLEEDWRGLVGDGYDVVLSLQAIHHLESWQKRTVYARIFDVLRPGGLFVHQERLAFDGRLWPHVRALWQVRPQDEGTEPHALDAELTYEQWLEAERAGGDKPDPIDLQLGWMRAIGFDAVDTFARLADRAVFGGLKPA